MKTEDTEHWLEWQELCTWEKCHPDTQNYLKRFAGISFAYWIRQIPILGPTTSSQIAGGAYEWAVFEQEMLIKVTRTGKRYKDDLFDSPKQGMESRAFSRMRDVVKSVHSYTRKKAVMGAASLDNPVSDVHGDLCLRDLLNPFRLTTENELAGEAAEVAQQLFPGLSERQKMTLIVSELGLRLNNPKILAFFGLDKSVLYAALASVTIKATEMVRQRTPDGDDDNYFIISKLTMRHLLNFAIDWGLSEKSCQPLFILGGQDE